MVLVSYSGREINAKLVYYGPGLSGKTTNLEFIYSSIPQGQRGKMVSMKTKTERTLFFDFLPVHLGELSGFKTRFLLYTVPGQVYYNATRKLVLKGVDAVVFVADSKRGKMDENVESLENLKENLKEHGLTLDKLPWVIQYNKRDLADVYSMEELEAVLNPGRVPAFEGVASTGQGVVETFKGISRLLLRKLAKEVGVPVVGASTEQGAPAAQPAPSAAPVESVAPLRAPFAPPAEPVAPQPMRFVTPEEPVAPQRIAAAPVLPSTPAEAPASASGWNLPPVAEPVRIEPAGTHVTLDAARPDRDGELPAGHLSVGERLRRWLSRSPEQDETEAGESEFTGRPAASPEVAEPPAARTVSDSTGIPPAVTPVAPVAPVAPIAPQPVHEAAVAPVAPQPVYEAAVAPVAPQPAHEAAVAPPFVGPAPRVDPMPSPSPAPPLEFERSTRFAELPVAENVEFETVEPMTSSSRVFVTSEDFMSREEPVDLAEVPGMPEIPEMPERPVVEARRSASPVPEPMEPPAIPLVRAETVVSIPTSPAASVVGAARPASPFPPRRRPREIIVPVELGPDDFAEGVVLKVAIRVRQSAEDMDEDAERYAA